MSDRPPVHRSASRLARVHPRVAMWLLLLLHTAATFVFLPPSEILRETPLYAADYPVHTHRVHMYRQALFSGGVPWGYDPDLSGGTVANPGQDAGAKPLQMLGVVFWFLSPGAVVRLFVFLAVLSLPVWILLGCRAAGIDKRFWPWILLVTIAPAWLDARIYGFWHWGLVSFVAAAFFSVYVLGRFIRYVSKPTAFRFVGLVFVSAALLLLHILGPVTVVPALVLATILVPSLTWTQRVALATIPLLVVILNAFWFYPLLLAQHIPQPPAFQPVYPPDSVVHLQFGPGSVLLSPFSNPWAIGPIVAAMAAAIVGLAFIRRRSGALVAGTLGITCLFGLVVTLFGSDLQLISQMQPVRFIVPTFAFLSIPIGVACGELSERMRLPAGSTASFIAIATAAVALVLGLPRPLDLPPEPDGLIRFIESETRPGERLMIQSPDGHKFSDYETKIFPLITGREVIGSNFPLIFDTPQFLNSMLLGREIKDWEAPSLQESLHLWGIHWIFTATPEAESLLTRTVGPPHDRVEERATFVAPFDASAFLLGQGRVSTGINRITLAELKSDSSLVVIRYRYHPGWRTVEGIPVLRYEIPDEPSGFIALENPPESVVLEFDAWHMLRANWPAEVANTVRVTSAGSSTDTLTILR